jgi:heptosyltransferase-2
MYQPLVEHNPYIDQCYYLDNDLSQLSGILDAERYTYIIDLHNNIRSNLITTLLATRVYKLDKRIVRRWLYVRWKLKAMPDEHIVDRYMATVRPLGVTNDGLGLDYFIPDQEQVAISQLPIAHQQGYIAFAIGGQHATKRLPTARIIELCQQLAEPIVLLGGAAEQAVGEAVERALGSQLIYNGCGRYSLNQSASLLSQARVVFSHDTGLMHMAAAFKKTVYSIWGSTTPQLGMYPYKTQYTVLEMPDLVCRPCSKMGRSRCPLHHFRCMNELPFDFKLPLPAKQADYSDYQ